MQAPDEQDTIGTEEAIRVRADLIAALVWIVLGLTVTYFSWTMDRLEIRRIHPSTVPGLVPLFLGIGLTLCGTLLAYRSAKLDVRGAGAALVRLLLSWTSVRVMSVLAMALIYTLGLVGRMPFWLASGIFMFTFILVFETVFADAPKSLWRTLFWGLVVAGAAGWGIHYVFGQIFLVRLP